MVVELIASIPPKKMLSILPHPKRCPTATPVNIIQNTMTTVAMTGEKPIFRIFLNEKSKPSEKRRNITPMSAHMWMLSWLATLIVYGMWGETRKPATKYPNTSGCFNRLNISVTMPATTRINARSTIRLESSVTAQMATL